MATADVDALLIRIAADASSLKAQLGSANKTVESFGQKVGATMKSVGTSMKNVGRKMTMWVTLPILGGAAASIKAFSNFDAAITKSVAIITDWGGATRAEMERVAIALSEKGVQSATELAESYFFLASAGLNAKQQIAALPIVQQFATAGMFDMALATDLLTDAFSALGLKSGTTAEQMAAMGLLGDQLVMANTLANASVEQFATSLTTKAGAAMKAFNIEATEGIAVLAAMADQGIKAELAGNGLDRVIRLLSKSSRAAAGAHAALGFEVFDSEGNMNNLGNIIMQLEVITAGMSDEMKSATLEMLGFEAQVQGMILPLLGTSEAILQYQEDLEGAGGTTEQIAENQMKSFSAQMGILWDKIKNVAREIGERLKPIVEKMNQWIEAAVEWYHGLSEGMKTTIMVILGVAAALGPLLVIVGTLIVAIGTVTIVMSKMAVALGFVSVKAMIAAAGMKVFTAAVAIAKLAIKAAPYLLAAAAIAKVVSEVYNWAAGMEEYNKQADRRNRLDKKMQDLTSKKLEGDLAGVAEMETGVEKIEKLKEMLNKAGKEVQGYRGQLGNAKDNAEELAPTAWSLWQAGKSVHQVALQDVEAKEKAYHIHQAHYEDLQKMIHEEEKAIELAKEKEEIEKRRFEAEGGIPRAAMAEEIASLEEMTAKLEEERDTIGMSASEMEVYKAKMKGATDAQLAELVATQQKNDAIQEEIDAINEANEANEKRRQTYKDMKESLQEEIETMGMSAHELRMYKAEKEGLNSLEMAIVKVKSKELEKLKEEQKMMEKGKQLTESLMTPEEKFAKGREELNKMLAEGAIDLETYTRAMEKLEKDTTVKVKFNISGVDAVAAGSAEAAARLEEFRALADGGNKVDYREEGRKVKREAGKKTAPVPGVPESDTKEGSKNLNDIAANTRIMAERTPVVVEEAGLV